LRIGREIAEGLAAAHEAGLMHRDIKPANIWLEGQRRRVKILDFGLARAEVDSDQDNSALTASRAIVGTPAYMSPEQASGQGVDSRTDLFSLGVVLYLICTGEQPFRGPNTMAILTSLAIVEPPPPRSKNAAVPPRLDRLIR
jgi:eukaryotic-like serine/threonine-protein kinase